MSTQLAGPAKVRYNLMRDRATRRGMFLSRSSRRDPAAIGYGRYFLYSSRNQETRIQLWPHSPNGASAEEMHAFLASGGIIYPQPATDATEARTAMNPTTTNEESTAPRSNERGQS